MAVRAAILVLWVLLAAGAAAGETPPAASTPDELALVRARIERLQRRLDELDSRASDARLAESRIEAQLQLAEARVEEVETLLRRSRDEILALRAQAVELAGELRNRREALRAFLAMGALLGPPGPLQLLFDAARGGGLSRSLGTLSVLTTGQLRLLQEYDELARRHRDRLAELSGVLNRAQAEAAELERRRGELEAVRAEAARRRKRLERQVVRARNRLEEYREREAALERLMGLLARRDRMTGNDDIRRYRGALPWPAAGRVVKTFGRHRLEEYDTYTVCNGLRLEVEGGAPVGAVFPGVVAYARHFKGYGNMVVVDHGHGVYSLVAGLATILVRRDQNVAMGTPLGLASPPKEGGNLYIEIREGGRPTDPRRWLRLQEVKR